MDPGSETALVTGGRGSLGRGIVAALRQAGWWVATIGPARLGDDASHVGTDGPCDVDDIVAALAALRPTLVLHLAAVRGVPAAVLRRQDRARRDEPLRVIGGPSLLRSLGVTPAGFDLGTPAPEIMAPWSG